MDADSDRCGSGSETSTYDSLDHSLGRARGSLYLGVKTWAAYVCMEALFTRLGAESRADSCADFGADWWERQAEAARVGAGLAAETIASGAREPDGRLPALLDGTSEALILPALEGLVYPRFCGAGRALSRTGFYAKLILALERHALAALKPGVCIDAESGGWKLSSTSPNTWLSKIFLNQYAAREVLGIEDDWEKRDSVHASWLKTGCADFAATDQVDSRTGRDLGSRLYPRLVSSALWLE